MNQRSKLFLEDIRSTFLSSGDPHAVLEERTAEVDRMVTEAFQQYLLPFYPAEVSILAVGGYGRRELFPYSDIDVLLLIEKAPHNEATREALSLFLRALWDAGLRLSHSVRSIDECCQLHLQNLELNISLLDLRYLCGDAEQYERLRRRWDKFLTAERIPLARQLIRLVRDRQEKFNHTVYHLEPNIKEAPGGLRDLQAIAWLGKLQDPAREMPDWLTELADARRYLYELRCRLHFEAQRDQNLLQFDSQEIIAAQQGVSSASFMRTYYLNARRVYRAVLQAVDISESAIPSGLLGQFREWRSRLGTSEISVVKDRVFLKTPALLESDPDVSMRLVRFSARHGIPFAADTERRIAAALPSLTAHYSQPGPVWNYLKEILVQPHAVLALRTMHEIGLLAAVIPEWKLIEGLVIRDFYHRYTVDEHTLVVIEQLLALRTRGDGEVRRFADLLTEIEALPSLLLAILLHDIGKGVDGPTHSHESARLASTVMERIGVPEDERPLVQFLITEHLALSSVMNSRDLNDPATARHLADRVSTVEQLRYLTLLTYADISGVNATSMTAWRLEQLWRTYLIGRRELTSELDTHRIGDATGPAATHEFLRGFPHRYLRTHTPREIESHILLAAKARAEGVALDLVRQGGIWNLTVITADRPRLFAALAGALAGSGMDILKAEAFANHRGEVLDSLSFADTGRNLELNPPEIDRLRQTIERVVRGTIEPDSLLASRRRKPIPKLKPTLHPSISFDNEASAQATLVEIVAEDRIGLLYELSSTFSAAGCNIEVVLIDTEAHKAMDVFYVTREGHKLGPAEISALRSKLLKVCRE